MGFVVVYDISYKGEYGYNARRAKMPEIIYKSNVNNSNNRKKVLVLT